MTAMLLTPAAEGRMHVGSIRLSLMSKSYIPSGVSSNNLAVLPNIIVPVAPVYDPVP